MARESDDCIDLGGDLMVNDIIYENLSWILLSGSDTHFRLGRTNSLWCCIYRNGDLAYCNNSTEWLLFKIYIHKSKAS